MIRHIISIAILVISFTVKAEVIPCMDDPDTVRKTSYEAILKTYLLPIDLNSPSKDLRVRLSHQDYRFIAIGGFVLMYPGLENKELLCPYGFRYILGTSDSLHSKEHGELMRKFNIYAKEYNILLEAKLSER